MFEPYFTGHGLSKDDVRYRFTQVIGLRVSSMHPEQRQLNLLEQTTALGSMRDPASAFHPPTAELIADLYEETITPTSSEEILIVQGDKFITNATELDEPRVVGRDDKLREIQEFWDDRWSRTLAITGAGGVAKTALLDAFVYCLYHQAIRPNATPNPEVLIYLTAKQNYLQGMKRAPEAQRFVTLRRVLEATLESMGCKPDVSRSIRTSTEDVYSLAESARILFALDNLESLDEREIGELNVFLRACPGFGIVRLSRSERRCEGVGWRAFSAWSRRRPRRLVAPTRVT